MKLIRENDVNKDELLFSRLQRILPAHRKELGKELTQEVRRERRNTLNHSSQECEAA